MSSSLLHSLKYLALNTFSDARARAGFNSSLFSPENNLRTKKVSYIFKTEIFMADLEQHIFFDNF